MKSILIVGLLMSASLAVQAASFSDEAEVLSVREIVQVVSHPVRNCWATNNVRAQAPSNGNSGAGTLVGAIAGGILGNQVGGGHGREAATAVGAVVGAITGSNLSASSGQTGSTQTCSETENLVRTTTGYEVTYRYGSVVETTQLSYRPGPSIPVVVDVRAGQ